jgi:undecaprenyl-diphosphatase
LDLIQSVTLGVIQGITEWLPISSTAHLKVIPALLHWPDPGASATAVMQLGTVAAVIIFFRYDIVNTLRGMWKAWRPGGNRNSPEARLGLAVLLGTLPICVAGLLLKDYIKGDFRSNYVIATALIVAGIILFVAEKLAQSRRFLPEITWRDGLIVGVAQAFALLPGVSRSGSTLTGAFFTGLNREAALRFSFLLSIPAVVLAGLYEMKDVVKEFNNPHPISPEATAVMQWTPLDLGIATVVSGVVGYASIAFLLKYLSKNSTLVFVIYRILLGVLLIYLLNTGKIAAQ